MIRSYLFVPANVERKMEKALSSEADAVIFDLEDAVEISQKSAARTFLLDFLERNELHHKKIVVRINPLSSSEGLNGVILGSHPKVDAIMLPKTDTSEDVQVLEREMKKEGRQEKDHPTEIIPLIETVSGLHHIHSILSSSEKVRKVAFGAIDFALDMDVLDPDPALLNHVKAEISLATRIQKKDKPIDSIHPDFKRLGLVEQETVLAKRLGFFGKMAIHPAQLEPVNRIFSVTAEEIAEAKEIVDQFEEAEKQGIAAIRINGKMVDYPVYKKALQILNERR